MHIRHISRWLTSIKRVCITMAPCHTCVRNHNTLGQHTIPPQPTAQHQRGSTACWYSRSCCHTVPVSALLQPFSGTAASGGGDAPLPASFQRISGSTAALPASPSSTSDAPQLAGTLAPQTHETKPMQMSGMSGTAPALQQPVSSTAAADAVIAPLPPSPQHFSGSAAILPASSSSINNALLMDMSFNNSLQAQVPSAIERWTPTVTPLQTQCAGA